MYCNLRAVRRVKFRDGSEQPRCFQHRTHKEPGIIGYTICKDTDRCTVMVMVDEQDLATRVAAAVEAEKRAPDPTFEERLTKSYPPVEMVPRFKGEGGAFGGAGSSGGWDESNSKGPGSDRDVPFQTYDAPSSYDPGPSSSDSGSSSSDSSSSSSSNE